MVYNLIHKLVRIVSDYSYMCIYGEHFFTNSNNDLRKPTTECKSIKMIGRESTEYAYVLYKCSSVRLGTVTTISRVNPTPSHPEQGVRQVEKRVIRSFPSVRSNALRLARYSAFRCSPHGKECLPGQTDIQTRVRHRGKKCPNMSYCIQ